MKNKLMKLFALLLSILAITCFAFACTPDSGITGGGSGNGEQNQEVENGSKDDTQEDNGDETPKHIHSYALKFDSNNHWQECSCGDKKDSAKHSGGTATCKNKAKCLTCEQEYGDIGIHQYANGRCECGEYEPTYYTDGLVFELNADNQSYYVKSCTGNATEVVIPSIYQNKPVTSIGNFAFAFRFSLESIEIPNSVTSIGYEAFYNCSSLTSIEIPNSVTSIGFSAFAYCNTLVSIEIPDSVTSIGFSAFCGCSSLANIEIPTSVTCIEDWVFAFCYSLESIEIPDSVTSIGSSAFYLCSSLANIIVDTVNEYYKSVDGNLYSKDGKTLIQYAIGKKAIDF